MTAQPTGKCPICTINLYGNEIQELAVPVKTEKGASVKTISGKPSVFPCGINREKQGRCPWESEKVQKGLTVTQDYEKIAGVLGTSHGDNFIG